jgi:hypothetical protein
LSDRPEAGGGGARAMACAIKKLAVEINHNPARSNHVSILDRHLRVCPYGGHGKRLIEAAIPDRVGYRSESQTSFSSL